MLIFISDLHLTDGTVADTLSPDAFGVFTTALESIIARSNPQEVRLVLLGDIFEAVASSEWSKTELRPWSDPDERDMNNLRLSDIATGIASAVVNHPANINGWNRLRDFTGHFEDRKIPFNICYLPGNHDRFLNCFEESRSVLARFMGLPAQQEPFPDEFFFSDYRAFARHGEKHDTLNRSTAGCGSSLGDALVTDLLTPFILECRKMAENDSAPTALNEALRDLAGIRPLTDIPAYLVGLSPEIGDDIVRMKHIWDSHAKRFTSLDFLNNHDRRFRWDLANTIKTALFISRKMKVETASRLLSISRLRNMYHKPEALAGYARKEDYFSSGQADFIVYGHTHLPAIVPLCRDDKKGKVESYYLNSGTWRRVLERCHSGYRFSAWNAMSFICLYGDGEKKDTLGNPRRFEMWTGNLR